MPGLRYTKVVLKFLVQAALPVFLILTLGACAHLNKQANSREKAKLYLQKAADELKTRSYQLSLQSTFEALKQDPQYAAAYNHLALVYLETKRYEKASEAFQKALKLQPSYPEVHNNLGVMLNRRGQYNKAIGHFKKALAADRYATPENAYTNMGFSHYKLGELKQAKANHRKAMEIAPYFCLASKNMGDTYAKERKYRRAADYYKKAVTHCPLFQESHYKYGLALMKVGDRKLARKQLEKLLQRHREGPYVDRSQKVLKYLR